MRENISTGDWKGKANTRSLQAQSIKVKTMAEVMPSSGSGPDSHAAGPKAHKESGAPHPHKCYQWCNVFRIS